MRLVFRLLGVFLQLIRLFATGKWTYWRILSWVNIPWDYWRLIEVSARSTWKDMNMNVVPSMMESRWCNLSLFCYIKTCISNPIYLCICIEPSQTIFSQGVIVIFFWNKTFTTSICFSLHQPETTLIVACLYWAGMVVINSPFNEGQSFIHSCKTSIEMEKSTILMVFTMKYGDFPWLW